MCLIRLAGISDAAQPRSLPSNARCRHAELASPSQRLDVQAWDRVLDRAPASNTLRRDCECMAYVCNGLVGPCLTAANALLQAPRLSAIIQAWTTP